MPIGLKITPVVQHLRLYKQEDIKEFQPYLGIVTILHLSAEVIELQGALMTIRLEEQKWKQVLLFLFEKINPVTILAYRAEGHELPFGKAIKQEKGLYLWEIHKTDIPE